MTAGTWAAGEHRGLCSPAVSCTPSRLLGTHAPRRRVCPCRTRRARQKVNYAFNDYDETLRSGAWERLVCSFLVHEPAGSCILPYALHCNRTPCAVPHLPVVPCPPLFRHAAIRQTQRGESDSEEEGNGRRRRRVSAAASTAAWPARCAVIGVLLAELLQLLQDAALHCCKLRQLLYILF